MRSTVRTRLAWLGLALAVTASAVAVPPAAGEPRPGAPRRSRALNLFAAAGFLFEVNRIQCGLANFGEVCVAFAGSPVGGGGFWPKGTPDQYIFNSGLQIAGVVDAGAGFAWAGDTVGAFFFDARGDQASGDGLTGIFSSLDLQDQASWPVAARVLDPGIYNPVLLGRDAISQGDAWVRYWEGNPTFLTGRTHPMGLLVEQRALGWNFPSGNEDIIYFIFTFYNVTARNAAAYNNPTIPALIQSDIAQFGAQFQDLNENRFKLDIPDAGYTITDLFAAFAMDADVAVFSTNYSTAILPFNIGMTYAGDFLPEVGWQFPPDVFGKPFFPAPGFIGVKYLKSPTDALGNEVGLTLFSNTLNAPTGFPDPVGVNQLYRYLSGFVGPADNPCSPFSDPAVARERRLCFLAQNQADSRFYQASGPFALPPGEARTIVVAYIQAAPTEAVAGLVGTDVKPGIPFTGDSIFQDPGKIRPIERIAGWAGQADNDGSGSIEQEEVVTTPRSLLNKALVAQAVFDNGFLLPFSPEAPVFHLVPGDNQVSVVWQQSPSETNGDPFFAIASEPVDSLGSPNPLFDPNFRGSGVPGDPNRSDVEGYRIYRGRTASQLELIAQFDYSGTTFLDFTGAIAYGDVNGDGLSQCAPELALTADCPADFAAGESESVPLVGAVIQIPPGGRVELASGDVLHLRADTLVTGGGSGFPALSDNGVPFAFVDTEVRNSFTYHYTVTAFDVNSIRSGPSSLESPRVTKRVTPRKPARNEVQAQLISGLFGDDGVELDPAGLWGIDPNTGRFAGTPPPTDGIEAVFAPIVQQLLPALELTARIDSLVPHSFVDFSCGAAENALGSCYDIFLTFDSSGVEKPFRVLALWPVWSAFGEPGTVEEALGALAISPDAASIARFGIPQGFVNITASLSGTLREYIRFSALEGQAARRAGSSGIPDLGGGAGVSPGGSRWFSGTDETEDHPGYGIRVGTLPGTDTVWAPIHHTDTDPLTGGVQSYAASGAMQCFSYTMGGLARQADVRLTWGAGGTISAVRDLTHHVDVQFKPNPQATYGFIGDANGNGFIDWRDFNYLEVSSQNAEGLGFCGHTDPGPGARAQLVQQPIIMAVAIGSDPTTGTGDGFGLYINGERYIVELTGGLPPAAGTEWTLRTYAGLVSATTDAATTTPSGYRLRAVTRPPIIPGLQVTFNVSQPTMTVPETAEVLANVHTVPDPYYVTNALEITANQKVLKFVNLPSRAIIRIYSVSGVLVNVLVHDDAGLGGEATWNLRNRNNQFVASGVYFYHVETPAGHTKVGRFTVVNFAP